MKEANTISGHLKDLGKRDLSVAYDCTQWLKPNQRDIARRARPKRLAYRYIAACMIVEASENPSFAKEVLDRTEGKVPDRLDVNEKRSINIRIELASSGLLPPDNLVTQAQQVIEGMAVIDHSLDQLSSAVEGPGPGDRGHGVWKKPAPATPVDPPGSHHGGSEE